MKKGSSLFALVVFLGALSASPMFAQDAPRTPRKLQVTAADRAAAAAISVVHSHSLTTKTEAGTLLKHRESAVRNARSAEPFRGFSEGSSVEGNDHLRFPGDLTFLGGPTVPFAESHPIFLASPDGTTCPANTCWGDPDTFLNAYGRSGLAQITNQYVGQSANDRYTLGDQFVLPFAPSSTPLIDADIQAIVHDAAALSGEAGLDHIFHVFLPPGQDVCFNATFTACYSPDNLSTFAFCGYHSGAIFTDVGLVLYTVQPFQDVILCHVRPGTPNGQLIDSTNNVLSHELTETITDPESDAWINFTDIALAGDEIGDECEFFVILQVAPNTFVQFFDPTTFRVGRQAFATQPEYSNQDHACAIRP